jgi:hypothetical protein
MIVHNIGKNFTLAKFRSIARTMAVIVKEVPVKAHNSVGLVERYYAPLRQAFKIFREDGFNREVALQMAVKVVNDIAGPDRLVLTLLVFGVYPRIIKQSPLSLLIAVRAKSLRKAT